LWTTKVADIIYQFRDQDKVILDRLLVNFSKVGFGGRDEAVAVLKYEGGIGVDSDLALELACAPRAAWLAW
jgi:hypothetical protein